MAEFSNDGVINKEEFIKTFQHDECSFLKTCFGDKHKENKDDDNCSQVDSFIILSTICGDVVDYSIDKEYTDNHEYQLNYGDCEDV
jgi:hypothetical protein